MKRSVLALASAFVFMFVQEAASLTYNLRTPEDAARRCTAATVGVVSSIKEAYPTDPFLSRYPHLEVTVDVRSVLLGNPPPVVTILSDMDRGSQIHPSFEGGDSVLLFLDPYAEGDDRFIVLGMKNGTFHITGNKLNGTSTTVDEFVSQFNALRANEIDSLAVPRGGSTVAPATKSLYSGRAVIHEPNFAHASGSITYRYNPANAPSDTTTVRDRIVGGAALWNSISTSDLSVSLSSSETSTGYDHTDSENVVTWADLNANILGEAAFALGGDVKINNDDPDDVDWYYGSLSSVPADKHDFLSVVAHEMGHNLDLDHPTYGSDGIMRNGLSTGTRLTVHAYDKLGISYLYTQPVAGNQPTTWLHWAYDSSVTLPGTVNVQSGRYLTVENTTVSMNGYNLLDTGGTITHGTGAAYNPDICRSGSSESQYGTIQAAIDAASAGETVSIWTAGTYAENLTLKNDVYLRNYSGGTVLIDPPSGNAIFADNSYWWQLDGIDTADPVRIEDSSEIEIKNCDFVFNNSNSVVISNTDDLLIYNSKVSNTKDGSDGLQLSDSDPDFQSTKIWDNGGYSYGGYGIYCQNGSEPNLTGSGAQNDFSYNYDEDIYATSNCGNIDATYNRWNENPDVTHAGAPTYSINTSNATVYKPAPARNGRTEVAQDLVSEGRALASERKHTEALQAYKQVIEQYADLPAAKHALGQIASSYGAQRLNQDAVSYLDQIAQDYSNSDLGILAEFLRFRHLVRVEAVNYQDLLAQLDAFIACHPESEYVPYAMLRKGRIYLNRLGNPEAAEGIFEEVTDAFSERSEIQRLASIFLRTAREQLGTSSVPVIAAAELEPKDLTVSPNPFNPSTTLSFSLPSSENVQLIVYNALGQEVRKLITGSRMPAGLHNIAWDGTDQQGRAAASGFYAAVLQAGPVRSTSTMVLLK